MAPNKWCVEAKDPVVCQAVQELAFKHGWRWGGNTEGGDTPQFLDNCGYLEFDQERRVFFRTLPNWSKPDCAEVKDIVVLCQYLVKTEEPINIGRHRVAFLDNGDIQVGCQTIAANNVFHILAMWNGRRYLAHSGLDQVYVTVPTPRDSACLQRLAFQFGWRWGGTSKDDPQQVVNTSAKYLVLYFHEKCIYYSHDLAERYQEVTGLVELLDALQFPTRATTSDGREITIGGEVVEFRKDNTIAVGDIQVPAETVEAIRKQWQEVKRQKKGAS